MPTSRNNYIARDIKLIMDMTSIKYVGLYISKLHFPDHCLFTCFLDILWVFHMMPPTQLLSLVSIRFWLNYQMSLGWQKAFYIGFSNFVSKKRRCFSMMRSNYFIERIRFDWLIYCFADSSTLLRSFECGKLTYPHGSWAGFLSR